MRFPLKCISHQPAILTQALLRDFQAIEQVVEFGAWQRLVGAVESNGENGILDLGNFAPHHSPVIQFFQAYTRRSGPYHIVHAVHIPHIPQAGAQITNSRRRGNEVDAQRRLTQLQNAGFGFFPVRSLHLGRFQGQGPAHHHYQTNADHQRQHSSATCSIA